MPAFMAALANGVGVLVRKTSSAGVSVCLCVHVCACASLQGLNNGTSHQVKTYADGCYLGQTPAKAVLYLCVSKRP